MTLKPTGKTLPPDGAKPVAIDGYEWRQEKNPSAGSAEAKWHWVEYKIET